MKKTKEVRKAAKTTKTPVVNPKHYRLRGAIVGLSGFIGQHHLSAARGVISPHITIDACVPGSEENFVQNFDGAIKMGFDTKRIYRTLDEMLVAEKGRIDFVIIATPNYLHRTQCIAVAEAGLHLVCDKPLGMDADEATRIVAAVEKTGIKSCVTATYCGHAAVIEARHIIQNVWKCADELQGGTFSYFQRWLRKKLATMKAEEGLKQAMWRKDAKLSGEGGAAGDILSHLIFEFCFVTGLDFYNVRAQRDFIIEAASSESTDDQVLAVFGFEDDKTITMEAKQYVGGHQNDNKFELNFSDGKSIGWDVRDSEVLWVTPDGGSRRILTRDDFRSPILPATHTMPAMHIDGWHDADARLLTSFAWDVLGTPLPKGVKPFHPTVQLARNVNAYIDAVIASSDNGPFTYESII